MNMIPGTGESRRPRPGYLRIGHGMSKAIRSPKEARNRLFFVGQPSDAKI